MRLRAEFVFVIGIFMLLFSCSFFIERKSVSIAIASVFLFYCLFFVRKRIFNPHPTLLLVALLLSTALPLLVSFLFDLPILQLSEIRSRFQRDDWIAEALLVVLLQAAILIVFTLNSKGGGVVSLIHSDRKKSSIVFWIAVLGMTLSSVMANQVGTVFDGGYGKDDFYHGSGWFGGWPLLFVVFSALYFCETGLSSLKHYVVIYGFVAYWLLHGNRSEVLVQAVLPFFLYVYRGGFRMQDLPFQTNEMPNSISRKHIFLATSGMLTVFLAFQAIGFFRETGTAEGSVGQYQAVSESRGVVLSTIGPSAYTLVSAIGLIAEGTQHYRYGMSYLDYLNRTLPAGLGVGGAVTEDLADVFVQEAEAIGGSHFAAEAYLNGGIIGTVLYAAIVAMLINQLIASSEVSLVSRVFLISIVFYFPRIAWYGNIYLYKLSLLFLVVYAIKHLSKMIRR